ncbi:MAG: hypothetical protein WKF92_01910 [Pyrinomonadaceae bacterium]
MKFNSQIIKCLICLLLAAGISNAQSDSQNFPTPITSNEITGVIRARDVGDSRLTTYYYGFDGTQGDIFVNLVTKNFNGDIDVFAVGGQQSLTKVVVYADLAESETGRVIYLRKPEKLLLRVQGRSPNDDPASFRVKFAGSYVASKDTGEQPELPKVIAENTSGIRVNSVGTIIEVLPKAEITDVEKTELKSPDQTVAEISEKTTNKEPAEVVVTDQLPKPEETIASKSPRTKISKTRAKSPPKPKKTLKAETSEPSVRAERKKSEPKKTVPDPLANIRLVILFKNGSVIERPMNEVFRFSVDKGVLTVTSKNGSIGRYPLLDVTKVTIE